MTKETDQIFSSTGRLGVSRRPFARLYVNGTRFSSDSNEVDGNFRRLVKISERYSSRIGRSIFRGLVGSGVMQHIAESDLQSHVEVAFSVEEFTGDDSWLVYLAKNREDRGQIVSSDIMIAETTRDKQITPPQNRAYEIIEQSYNFINYIPEDKVDQVFELWGETFGWERHEVENLRRRLIANRNRTPHEKDVWFSAIRNNGTVVSVAMAEKLSIPTRNGVLDLVESTEWRTRDEYRGNGLMTGTLAMLNAQIIADLRNNPNGLPLIYAECNFQSRSDRAGYGAGFRIPIRSADGNPAPQILVQNVLVGDHQIVPEGKLRDFTFMYMPLQVINMHYGVTQIQEMLGEIQHSI